ncbi:MAG: chromosomal replication initiator protein DnaA [Sphingomonadales bacterium]|nr:chromosomal replication initiator protein DnaA [Sphingomonadales bacterium]
MSLPPSISSLDLTGSDALALAWDDIRKSLRQSIGARSFDHWLKPVALAGWLAEEGMVRLSLPSEFMASWVRTHHGERLAQAWKAASPQVRGICIEVAGEAAERYEAKLDRPQAAATAKPDGHTFDPRLTFSRFVTGPANAVAANASQTFASGTSMRFNPLYIHSQTGQGKTHLLHAIGHEYQRTHPTARVLYMSAERFMFDFVSAMRARDTIAFKTRLRSADLLMIDDVQFIAGKDSTQEEFLHTVDELMSSGRKLVISADRAPQALDGVEGRILSRLTQGLVVDIQPPDYTLRRAIIGAKATAIEGVAIEDQVLDLLAARLATNVRELEGGLNRLLAYASLGNRPVTIEFAEEVLADMFRASRRRITIDEIQRRVSEHFRIRHAEMVSARRAREVARPRQIAMYLAKQLTPRSLPEIGRRFGGRDHTTVIHAVRQIERLRGEDSEIDNDVRTLIRVLEG